MTLKQLEFYIEIGDYILFLEEEVCYEIPNYKEYYGGIEYMLAYHYNGEFERINNTYIQHCDSNNIYIDTYQITLSPKEMEVMRGICERMTK